MSEHDTDAGGFRVSMVVSNVDSLQEVLESLNAQDATIQPASNGTNATSDSHLSIDLGTMTATQWETLERAYERGYYDQPRKVTLADLAEEFDVTKSAISQRLRGAEGTLVAATFEATQ